MKRIQILDYYKGFAILAIVLMHLIQDFIGKYSAIPNFFRTISSYGGAGGHVFILCSGFGLFLSQLHRKRTFVDFIKRRFKQIYVPYILVILISFCIPFINGGKNRLMGLLSHVFLFKMFSSEYISTFGTQMWFISTIIQLYIVFIPISKWIKKMLDNQKVNRVIILLIFMLISAAWMTFIYLIGKNDLRNWSGFFLSYLWEFAAGMLLADYYVKNKKMYLDTFSNFQMIAIFIISFSGYAVLSLQHNILKQYNDVFSIISFLTLITLIYRISPQVFGKLGEWLGSISYEWYLLHMATFIVVFRIIHFNVLVTAVLAITLSVFLSVIYSKLINFRKIKN